MNQSARVFNEDYQALQNEIDTYGDSLYADMLDSIYEGFKGTQEILIDSVNVLRVDMSAQLEDMLKRYIDCMSFHYDSDGGVGLVNYYWSSFFTALEQNYGLMLSLKNEIDSCIRRKYAMDRDYL